MNTFASSLSKALPSISRQCRTPAIQSMRSFSSTRASAVDPKGKGREMERRILKAQTASESIANENSALSAISRMMQDEPGRATPNVSRDYSRMAESLEAEMIKQPYADRLPPHHLHVYAHKHNTILTLTRPNGNPLLSLGCGNMGFRKSGRGGYDPAYQLAVHVFAQIQERGLMMDISRLEIILRGFGQGREAFTKVLLGGEGKNIRGLVSRVADATRIKFGGTRSRKVRRLG